MKYFFIFILSLFFVMQSFADSKDGKTFSETTNASTYYILGTVNDLVTGESLVGVEVKIEGTDLKTYTDFDGNFTFNNVKPGEYKVVANYISYKPASESLEAGNKKSELKLKLQPLN